MIPDWLPEALAPFQGIEGWKIALLIAIYAVTASIRGALGFGAVAPAIVFSSMILPPHHAVLLALVTGVWAQGQIIPFGLRHGDWRLARPMLLAGFLAIGVGVLIFKAMDPGWLTVCLGVTMAGIAAMDRYQVLEKLANRIDLHHIGVAFGLSTVGGLMAGIAGGGGMYLYSVYLRFACPTPTAMRGTSILIGSTFLIWRFLVTLAVGLVTWRLVVESLILLPVSLGGAWLGIRFFRRADAARFYGVFQLVLMIGAGALLWKGLMAVL